jgi:DNA-3-methyladenine glycosylase I
MTAKPHADGLARCTWPGLEHPEYVHYHDTEWGVPCADDIKLFEKLILEGFQAGLSWLTILRKREHFRTALHGFRPEKIARYTDKDIARLMADAGIVRNKMKVEATIDNARAFLKLQDRTTLSAFLWSFQDGRAVINRYKGHGDVPAKTEISTAMSKALLKEGFRFVGPTTVYAFMQSMGFVNDHLVGCHRHKACAEMQNTWRVTAKKM